MIQKKKKFGQNFLIDLSILNRIIELIKVTNSEQLPVIEIGPGEGALTIPLQSIYKYTVLEIDKEIQQYFADFVDYKQSFILQDCLQVDWSSIYNGETCLVGNFPYNISSPIVFKMIEHRTVIQQCIGMFQMEVGKRITAIKGKQYGLLSVAVQLFYEVEYQFTIKPEAFDPSPKVDSCIVTFIRRDKPLIPNEDWQGVLELLKECFKFKRKNLRNNLKNTKYDITKLSEELLLKRAEQIGIDEWNDLYNKLK